VRTAATKQSSAEIANLATATAYCVFNPSMSDDLSLSTRLAGDLDGSFEDLVRTFQDRLYGFTLRLTGSRQDAEESAQDTFVRAYRALQRYPADRVKELKLKPWLYQIALNVVRNRVRRPQLAAVAIDEPVANSLHLTVADEQPEAAALTLELHGRLQQAIDQLPERYALAVVLRHIQGLSYDEAALVLDQPVGTTKSDVHRGLRLLRSALEPESTLVGEFA
jgi:RNA polymerase sigma-70 factor (ECF subfamily)